MTGEDQDLEAAFKRSREAGVAAVQERSAVTAGDILSAIGVSVTDGGSWFCLAECLLLLVQRDGAHWEAGLRDFGRNVMENAVADASAAIGLILPKRPQSLVGAALAAEIRREVELLIADGPEIAVAHVVGLLVAVDDKTNETFEDWLQARLRMTIEPGRAYPVGGFDPRTWMDGSANTQPAHHPSADPLKKTAHVRLGCDDHRLYRTVIDWDMKGRLLPLRQRKSLKIATVHAHETLLDFDIELHADGTGANRGPSNPEAATAVYQRLLSLADEAEAGIAVIPEYCVSDPMRGALLSSVAKANNIVVSVLGTGLVGRSNEALLAVGRPADSAAKPRTVETKMIPKFTIAETLGIREDADASQPYIQIWRSDGMSLVVLTCRDAADESVIRILGEAGVTICLVPSFTDRLAGISGQVEALATTAQSWVAVAVAPRAFGFEPAAVPTHEAFFRGPYGDDRAPASQSVPEGHDAPLPGIWLFDSRSPAPDPGRVDYLPLGHA